MRKPIHQMKNFIAILLLFCTLNVLAQGEANHWFFGRGAGIDFKGGTASPISGSSINTYEGCASFSNANGDLLFYTDGIKVWNKNHTIMPNGTNLLGNPSSTQSAIIVPHPGNSSLFYIFTVGANDYDRAGNLIRSTDGLNCYTVDMSSNGGLGDVVGSSIDLSIGQNAQWTEKVTSVKGAECNTFWVISLVNNTFVSYKIDINGLNTTPIPSPVNYSESDPRGYLKASPNGKKIASAAQGNRGNLLLYSFNDITGKVANDGQLLISNIGLDGQSYGVEFSPRSSKLYCATYNYDTNINKLFQFDLENPNIISGKILINSKFGFRGALQLAPNGKIYATVPPSYDNGTRFLDAINLPDELGINCNYQENAIDLGSGRAMQGLPPFIASIASIFSQIEITTIDDKGIKHIINDQTIDLCNGSNFEAIPEPLSGTVTYKWYFNNASTPFSSLENLPFTNLTPAENGLYSLVVIQTDTCGIIKTLKGEFSIAVHDSPSINSFFELKQCDEDGVADGFTDFNLNEANDFLTIGDTSLKVTYFLNYNDADSGVNEIGVSSFSNKTQTIVYARIENQYGCHSIAQVDLLVSSTSFLPNYLKIMTHCDNDDIIDGFDMFNLAENSNDIIAQFPTGQNLSVSYYRNLMDAQLEENEIPQNKPYINEIPFNQAIYVRVESEDNGECFGLGPHLNLVVEQRPEFELDETVIYCLNLPPITVSTYNAKENYTYEWRNENGTVIGSNPFLEISSEGEYSVIATSIYGCKSYSKTIKVIPSIIASITQNDLTVVDDSENNSITISTNNLGIGDYEFSLNDPYGNYQDEPYFENIIYGIHLLYIRDKNSCGIAQIEVSVIGYPKFFTPNNDGYNDTWNVLGVSENFFQRASIYIFDRFGKLIAEIGLYSEGWNGTFNGKLLPSTDYWFSVELVDFKGNVRVKKGHFSLIRR